MRNGNATREERQKCGVIGEIAFHDYMALDKELVRSNGKKDGGTDAVITYRHTGIRHAVQIKTWMKYTKRHHLYEPPHIPMKAHVIAACALIAPNAVRMIGFIMKKDFDDRCMEKFFDSKVCRAITQDGLSNMSRLYLATKGPRPWTAT